MGRIFNYGDVLNEHCPGVGHCSPVETASSAGGQGWCYISKRSEQSNEGDLPAIGEGAQALLDGQSIHLLYSLSSNIQKFIGFGIITGNCHLFAVEHYSLYLVLFRKWTAATKVKSLPVDCNAAKEGENERCRLNRIFRRGSEWEQKARAGPWRFGK